MVQLLRHIRRHEDDVSDVASAHALRPRCPVLGARAGAAGGSTALLASSSILPAHGQHNPCTWARHTNRHGRGTLRVLPGEGAPNGRAAMGDLRGHRDPREGVALSSAHTAHGTDDGVSQGIIEGVNAGWLRRAALTI